MERLTTRTSEGEAIQRMDLRNNGDRRCTARLAEYEDIGLTPGQIQRRLQALSLIMDIIDSI